MVWRCYCGSSVRPSCSYDYVPCYPLSPWPVCTMLRRTTGVSARQKKTLVVLYLPRRLPLRIEHCASDAAGDVESAYVHLWIPYRRHHHGRRCFCSKSRRQTQTPLDEGPKKIESPANQSSLKRMNRS